MKPVLFFSFLILFFTSGCSPQPDSIEHLFRHRIIDFHPNTGKDCCTDVLMMGDINGDGQQDVIVGAEHAERDGLVWYQYPTWEKHPIASGEFTTDGQTADVDGDGDLDIVIGNYIPDSQTIDWFENVSGTDQEQWIRHVVGEGYAHDLEVGDIEGDGDLDIVTCDKKQLVLWEQLTSEEFRRHVVLEGNGEGTKLADINNDGMLDIVHGGSWLENPGHLNGMKWTSHPIAENWSLDTRVYITDMNSDGRLDAVLSVSEGNGKISWFEQPESLQDKAWIEHPIEKGTLEGAHSLQVVDLDNDGDLEIVTAEMHTSRSKRVLVYINEKGLFHPIVLSRKGSHNMRISDLDNDGDYDLIGKNYAGPRRIIEMWENQMSNIKEWNYISIDANRPQSQEGMMGLVFVDANQDSFIDIVAGSFLYLNPRGYLQNRWRRTRITPYVDVYFAVDVDGDSLTDFIGIEDSTLLWIESLSTEANSWVSRPIAKMPAKGRTQGYIVAALLPAAKPQLIFTRGKNHLYVLEIPSNPDISAWPLHLIFTGAEEEDLAVGDIDQDGDLDIAGVKADGEHAIWLENPGTFSMPWEAHLVGESKPWMDRVALADINKDGRLDFIATEERQDGKLTDSLYWYEAPLNPKRDSWHRHVIARHRSLNSMDIADIDGDGTVDIAVAEHTDLRDSNGALDNLTLIYFNKDQGQRWIPEIVERGPHSSHLGAKLIDLDNDGIKEIVSIGWNQYKHIHLWRKASSTYIQ